MNIRLLAILLLLASFASANPIEIHTCLANSNLFGNEMNLHFRIHNTSDAKLDLTRADLAYRFSDNADLNIFAYDIWWFSNGNASDAKISFYEIDSREKFFKLYFTSGEIESGGYAEIQLRVRKTDWSFFNMLDDYSLCSEFTSTEAKI